MNLQNPIIDQLNSPNENTRQNAVFKLGKLGDSGALRWLKISANDSSAIVRCKTANVLTNFADEDKAWHLLENLLNDDDIDVFACACSTLSKIQRDRAVDSLINQINTNIEERRQNIAANNLIKAGSRATSSVLVAYAASSGKQKAYYLKVLGRLQGNNTHPVFVDALNDQNYTVFWVATAIQRTIRDKEATIPLISSLNHHYRLRQIRAIDTLTYIGDQRASEPLLETIQDQEQNTDVRVRAMSCLAKINPKMTKEKLAGFLNAPNLELQEAALMVLSWIGGSNFVIAILEAANRNPSSPKSHQTIRNLGYYGDLDTLRKLEKSLSIAQNGYDLRITISIQEAIQRLHERLNNTENQSAT